MYRIIGKRASGKTGQLMLFAKKSGAVIACSNPSAMKVKATAYGITGIEFISYIDLITPGAKYDSILIDDLEEFASYVTSLDGADLLGFTMSEE